MSESHNRKSVFRVKLGTEFLYISCFKFVYQRVRRSRLVKSSEHITMEPESLNHSDVSSAAVSEPAVLMSTPPPFHNLFLSEGHIS